MATRRALLRIPALFGVLILLFSGVREAYAFGTCPMMHPGGGQVEVVDPHAHHGSQHEGGSADQEDSGCECRILCLSVPVPTPPEPVVLSFEPALPPEPATAHVVGDASLLPTLNLPYLLPFANAPPAVS